MKSSVKGTSVKTHARKHIMVLFAPVQVVIRKRKSANYSCFASVTGKLFWLPKQVLLSPCWCFAAELGCYCWRTRHICSDALCWFASRSENVGSSWQLTAVDRVFWHIHKATHNVSLRLPQTHCMPWACRPAFTPVWRLCRNTPVQGIHFPWQFT